MHKEELRGTVEAVMSEMPEQVTDMLGDVDLLIVETPEDGYAEVQKDFDDVEPFPADMKGVFVGEPLESDGDPDDEESETEEVIFPDGVIVLVAGNILNPEDAAIVLMHEVSHALGMDEDEVTALGLGIGPAEAETPAQPATEPTPDVNQEPS